MLRRIPGLGNLWTVDELEQEAYINSCSTVNPEGIILMKMYQLSKAG